MIWPSSQAVRDLPPLTVGDKDFGEADFEVLRLAALAIDEVIAACVGDGDGVTEGRHGDVRQLDGQAGGVLEVLVQRLALARGKRYVQRNEVIKILILESDSVLLQDLADRGRRIEELRMPVADA